MNSPFDDLPVLDWASLEEVHEQTAPVLKRAVEDRSVLRALIENARADERLFAMFERHLLLDYFVLLDEPERNFRVRLHIHTEDHKERPHNHRFPFTTVILRGWYDHLLHPAEVTDDLTFESLPCVYRTREVRHSCYTISQDLVHTTYTSPGTVSLIIRGPAVLDRSIIMDRETRTIWWRQGRQDESEERRAKVQMRPEGYEELITKLEKWDIL